MQKDTTKKARRKGSGEPCDFDCKVDLADAHATVAGGFVPLGFGFQRNGVAAAHVLNDPHRLRRVKRLSGSLRLA